MPPETTNTDVTGQIPEIDLHTFVRAADITSSQILITNSDGCIRYANPAFCRVSGYTLKEVVGRTFDLLLSERMPTGFYRQLQERLEQGDEWQGELHNRRKDGSCYLENAVITALTSSDGTITHFIKVSDDITAQRQSVERQQQRMQLVEAVNRANLDFMEQNNMRRMAEIILETCMAVTCSSFSVLYELLPNGNAGILALNSRLTEPEAGFSEVRYELMRHGHFEMPSHPSLFMAPVTECRTIVINEQNDNHWQSCACPICSVPVSSFTGIPLKVGHTIIGMIGLANSPYGYPADTVSDLESFSQACALAISAARAETVRKLTLDQLRQSQKMEAIGQLAGGISHDFNNLLTVISGYSSLALQKLGPEHSAVKDIEQVVNAGERAATLIRQLLAFGRRQILEPQPINVNIFITIIHKILCRLIGENITLSTRLSPDIGKVLADPSQIEQVIMNLVINARDALEHGGTITIETANETLDAAFIRHNRGAVEGEYVRISVVDTGMGMSTEIIARIFEPFFTTKSESGTGLGLATVYGIVKQNNGYIQVISTVGIGSEFRVYLPRLMKSAADMDSDGLSEETARPAGGNGLILVVEDEQEVLDITAVSLRSQGYDILVAGTPWTP